MTGPTPTGPKRATMSAVDTAWLRMDRPANLMMISGVLVLDRQVRLARVKRVLLAAALAAASREATVRSGMPSDSAISRLL